MTTTSTDEKPEKQTSDEEEFLREQIAINAEKKRKQDEARAKRNADVARSHKLRRPPGGAG